MFLINYSIYSFYFNTKILDMINMFAMLDIDTGVGHNARNCLSKMPRNIQGI